MRIVPNPILVRNTATYRMERVSILARKPGPLPFVPLALLRVNYLIGTLVGLFTRQIMLWAVPSPERPLSGYRRWDSGNSYLPFDDRAAFGAEQSAEVAQPDRN